MDTTDTGHGVRACLLHAEDVKRRKIFPSGHLVEERDEVRVQNVDDTPASRASNLTRLGVKFYDMYDDATNSEPDERTALGAAEAPADAQGPRWKWNFQPDANALRTFLNTPTPLPTGAVSVSAVANGFHIIFFE